MGKKKPTRNPSVIETPEDETLAWWLNMEATCLRGGDEPVNAPMPEPHPNEIATREAAANGLYPTIVDDDGNEVDPLDAVGVRHARK